MQITVCYFSLHGNAAAAGVNMDIYICMYVGMWCYICRKSDIKRKLNRTNIGSRHLK